jgi:hypothetical protein
MTGRFIGTHLRRSIVVDEEGQAGEWRIQSVELSDDGVIVRWLRRDGAPPQVPTEDEPMIEWARSPPVALHDDVGTAFVRQGGHGAGGGLTWRGETTFAPGVPGSARALTILGADVPVVLDLNQR